MKRLTFCITMIGAIVLVGSTAQAAKWRVPEDFATIQEAIDSPVVADGDRIIVAPGNHAGADVTKRVQIKGEDGAVIDSGPMHPAGLSMGQIRPRLLHVAERPRRCGKGRAEQPSHTPVDGPRTFAIIRARQAPVAELVDATDSKSVVREGVLVRVRPGAPTKIQ